MDKIGNYFVKALKILAFILRMFIGCLICGVVIAGAAYVYYSRDLPNVLELKDVRLQTPMQILSAEGELIATFGERRRIPLKFENIPPQVIQAVIATEDSRFYEHYGVDPIGILRALYIAAKSGSISQGGSTITQQVAKNFFLTPEKSISRKIREMILAIRMEQELSKQEILTLYLNKIYFGSRSYGVGSAAFTFFGKNAEDLTLSEAALLAGLPNAPSAFNPISYPNRAINRRNWVLHRMLDQGYINEEEYQTAINEPLNVSYHTPKLAFSAPYVAEMARQFMYEKFGENAYTDGFKVYTTISQKTQVPATESIHHYIFEYDMRHGYRGPEKTLWKPEEEAWDAEKIKTALRQYMSYGGLHAAVVLKSDEKSATAVLASGEKITLPYDGVKWARAFINDNQQGPMPTAVSAIVKVGQQIWVKKTDDVWWLSQIPSVNSALVSLDPDTGAIKALVGGFDFNLSKFNRATQAIRQIGSNIKPFVYTAALDKGLTMATMLNDAPILRTSAGSEAWRPKNSPANYAGPLRLRVGLGMSKNVMIVRAVRAVGISYTADYLERFGFPRSNISRNESLALGSASFTPLQVARAYTVIANGGYLVTPYIIDRIEYAEGGVLYQHTPEIACEDCLQELAYTEEERQAISLAHVENVTESTDADVPDPKALSADSGFVLPASIPFERLPINGEESVVIPAEQPEKIGPVYAPQVISSELAYIMKDALKTAVWGERNGDWRGTSWRSRALGRHDIGGKTGTTNQSKDAWFSGFGTGIVTTVWMGFDDHRRELGKARQDIYNDHSYIAGEGGARTVNPIWNDYMKAALQGVPEKEDPKPNKVITVTIDRKTGLLGKPGPTSVSEYFIEGTEPTEYTRKEVGTQIIDNDGSTSELF